MSKTGKEESHLTFELISPFVSTRYSHPVSEDFYRTVKNAKSFLSKYMRLEENILQVIYSSQNFEEYLLKSALDYYLFPIHDFDYFNDTRLKANLYVSSVLNAITGFRDQFPKFSGTTNQVSRRFRDLWDDQRAQSITLRFGERLRNYAQHQSQPVYSATTGGGWDTDRNLLESHVSFYGDVEAICVNRNIQKSEKDEYLEHFGERVDLALVLREMLGSVGKISVAVRQDLSADFEQAVSTCNECLSLVKPYSDINITHLSMRNVDHEVEGFDMFEDFVSRAKRLRTNMVMTNNERHYISSRARGHK